MAGNRIAARAVTGVVAAMVTAVAAATAVGFWLSYGGLHAFAWKAGWRGPESWAWPAAVDLFIIAGECGAMVSYLLRKRNVEPWLYLVLGFGASATFNVLHADPVALPWAPYVVAAVPPVAAMAALAALLRVAYVLAARATEEAAQEPAEAAPRATRKATPKATRGTGREAAQEAVQKALAAGQEPPSARALAAAHRISRGTAGAVLAGFNGHGPG